MRFLVGLVAGVVLALIALLRRRKDDGLTPSDAEPAWQPGGSSAGGTERAGEGGAPSAARPAAEPEPPSAAPEPVGAVEDRAPTPAAESAAADTGRPAGAEAARAPKLAELKAKYAWLSAFSDDEIRSVALLPAGAELEGWEGYLDVCHPGGEVVRPNAFGQTVPEGHVYVARSRVPEDTWYRLAHLGRPAPTD